MTPSPLRGPSSHCSSPRSKLSERSTSFGERKNPVFGQSMTQNPTMGVVNVLLGAEQGPCTQALVKAFLLLLPAHCWPGSSAATAENPCRGTADPAAQAKQSGQQREPSSVHKSYGIVPFCFSVQHKLNKAALTGFSTAPS